MADLEVLCRTSTILHTSRGRSPQPIREASAGPGQNPGSPGPKGPAAGSTLARESGRQPSGIRESTAPVPIPIPTAPQALEPSRPSGLVPKSRQPLCIPAAEQLLFIHHRHSCPDQGFCQHAPSFDFLSAEGAVINIVDAAGGTAGFQYG